MQRALLSECVLFLNRSSSGRQIMGVEFIYFRQKNSLDRRARTLHIEAWNESYATRVVINEKCRYTVSAGYRAVRRHVAYATGAGTDGSRAVC